MRVWDEDGVPDQESADFGEFVLKVRVFLYFSIKGTVLLLSCKCALQLAAVFLCGKQNVILAASVFAASTKCLPASTHMEGMHGLEL
jgi:hypothetical protein